MGKVMWLVFFGLLLSVGSVQADCGKCGTGDGAKMDHKAMVKEHIDRMTNELNLTAEQKVQLEIIMKEKLAKKQQIMEQKEAAIKALQDEFKGKVQGILTVEQMKKWEVNKERSDAKKMKGDMKGGCPDCKKGKMCPECKKKHAQMQHGHDTK